MYTDNMKYISTLSIVVCQCTCEGYSKAQACCCLVMREAAASQSAGFGRQYLGCQDLVSSLLHRTLQERLQPCPVSRRQLGGRARPPKCVPALRQHLQRCDVRDGERGRDQRRQPLEVLLRAPRLCPKRRLHIHTPCCSTSYPLHTPDATHSRPVQVADFNLLYRRHVRWVYTQQPLKDEMWGLAGR